MEALEELKKWVDSLTVAEKRYIKLVGKARAGAASQQLELFDLLNKPDFKNELPPKSKLRTNLPTIANRLKELMLDCLRILHKEDRVDTILGALMDEVAILFEKKLFRATARHLKRAKKLTLETCRYAAVLQCIHWERRLVQVLAQGDGIASLQELRDEEILFLKKQNELLDIQFRHDWMVSRMRQFSFRQETQVSKEIVKISSGELIQRLFESGGYLEQMYAANIIGLRLLYERKALDALLHYKAFFKHWQNHAAWQLDQAHLLLLASKFYQTACFYAPISWEEVQSYLLVLNQFNGLSEDAQRDFQRLLYHNQFTLALNMGHFDSVQKLILEIDAWIYRERKFLTEAFVLPFLCNFAIAEFLCGNHESANRFVVRILNLPNRKIRIDIREFALVLQAILQYELGNGRLNEYLVRSGKRHFSKNTYILEFESAVFYYLDLTLREHKPKVLKTARVKLLQELDQLAEQTQDAVSFLGLNEVRLWAQAKQQGVLLRDVFLEEIKKK
ncbi:MAG: hypothetical protein ACRCYO_04660 [Bacteroidia bacterium]